MQNVELGDQDELLGGVDEGVEGVDDVVIIVDAGTRVGGEDEEEGGLLGGAMADIRWTMLVEEDASLPQESDQFLSMERNYGDEPTEGLA